MTHLSTSMLPSQDRNDMARFEVLHNIPAPYRVHLFNCLADALAARGHVLHVHFFGSNNPDRPESWKRSLGDARFSHQIWDGYGIRIRGNTLWLNPRLILHVMRNPPAFLLHGGIWDSFTSLFAVLLTRPKRRIAWIEFNVDIPGRSQGIAGACKRFLLRRCDTLLVPGQKGLMFLERFMGSELLRKTIVMPNIVDETRFRDRLPASELEKAREALDLARDPNDTLVLIWPARLIGHKGVLEFLRHVDKRVLEGYAIRIIGEGPLRGEILAEIERRELTNHVKLVGKYIDYTLMPAVYQVGDALLLPSLHDPNPLSTVEALHSGMPLLLSDRVGNYKEALEAGVNGFGFDPADGAAVREALLKFRALSAEDRAHQGARSAEIGAAAWGSRACIERAVEGMLADGRRSAGEHTH